MTKSLIIIFFFLLCLLLTGALRAMGTTRSASRCQIALMMNGRQGASLLMKHNHLPTLHLLEIMPSNY